MTTIERKPLAYFRTPKARSKTLRVDHKGGDQGAGIIRGASLVTQGEALGHGMWLDNEFISQVNEALANNPKGIKARFTHPGLSADGLGTFMGRAKNPSISGDRVIADFHFAKSAHNTPDGDLAEYLMGLAGEDPESFAISIVFKPDFGAEDRFVAENEDEDGNFRSPDENNIDDLPHARLADLRAADFVDEPAANPDGLFHRGHEIAEEADRLCSYALGLTKEKPAIRLLSADVDRIAAFAARFLDSHGLEIKEQSSMASEKKEAEALGRDDIQGMIAESLKPISEQLSAITATLAKQPEKKEPGALAEATLAETTRCKELFSLAKNSGIEDWQKQADEWVDKNLSVIEAKASLADLAISRNKLTNDNGDGEPDPHAKFRAEFRAGKAEFQKFGIIDEDAYVRSRCRDEGLPVPEIKKAS